MAGWYSRVRIGSLSSKDIEGMIEEDTGFVTDSPEEMRNIIRHSSMFKLVFAEYLNGNRPLLLQTLRLAHHDWEEAHTYLWERCLSRTVQPGKDVLLPDGTILYKWGDGPWVTIDPDAAE